MIVYVEWVLFDNFFLDCLIGYLTLRLVRNKVDISNVILSAVVGCLFALLSPLIRSWSLLFKVGVLFVNAAILYLKRGFRGYLITTLVYVVLSFALSGILSFLLGGKVSSTYIGVSQGGLVGIISIGACLLLYICRQINGLIQEKRKGSKFAVAELSNGDKTIRLNALFDSGNLLMDENGENVVVSDRNALRSLGELTSFGEMTVHTAGGSKVLKLVKISCIKIYSEGYRNTLNNVTVALSDLPKEYAVILPA